VPRSPFRTVRADLPHTALQERLGRLTPCGRPSGTGDALITARQDPHSDTSFSSSPQETETFSRGAVGRVLLAHWAIDNTGLRVVAPSSWCCSLPPLAPRVLPRFPATMTALTPARNRRSGLLPAQVSTVHHDNFPTYPAQPPSTPAILTFNEASRSDRSWLAPQASPFPSRLANVAGRIGFTFVWVCGSASGCSPPRLTATQLPSAALPLLVSGGLRLSLVVSMVTSFALGTAGPAVRTLSKPQAAAR
jgi:hypothetical protein